MTTPKIRLVATTDTRFIPKYQTEQSAGMDVRANISGPITITKGQTVLVPLGFALDMQDTGLAAFLLPRSGMGHNRGIVLGNLVGLIDGDYQGQVFASVWNRNLKEPITIAPGERLAQLMFTPLVQPKLEVVTEFTTVTARGEGGFGHTGTTEDAVTVVENTEPVPAKTRKGKAGADK